MGWLCDFCSSRRLRGDLPPSLNAKKYLKTVKSLDSSAEDESENDEEEEDSQNDELSKEKRKLLVQPEQVKVQEARVKQAGLRASEKYAHGSSSNSSSTTLSPGTGRRLAEALAELAAVEQSRNVLLELVLLFFFCRLFHVNEGQGIFVVA